MLFRSTRSEAAPVPASEAILRGLAPDGGLYVPESFPRIDVADPALAALPYPELAHRVLLPYLAELGEGYLLDSLRAAYARFDSPEGAADPAPLREAGGLHYLELWRGPTAAFKDMALSLMPYLLRAARERAAWARGKEILILTATSGDTGKAALEAFSGQEGIRILVFYPADGVSAIQKLQMTSQEGANVGVAAIEGNFDDAQAGVKRIFSDAAIKAELEAEGTLLSSANSINVARLLPQVAYYFHAYFSLLRAGKLRAGEPFDVAVPTGNFGNILAAYYAMRMGLPVGRFVCASNRNRVLADFFSRAAYDSKREFYVTSSPSMDILVSSNLERLLFEASGRSSAEVAALMAALGRAGSYEVPASFQPTLALFEGGSAGESATDAAIARVHASTGYLIDPHTAVAVAVARELGLPGGRPLVVACTASPFKFPAAVARALELPAGGLDEFDILNLLSDKARAPLPRCIAGLREKPVLHEGVHRKDAIVEAFWAFARGN